MADGQLKIEVVVDGVDIDKVKKKIKELKAEATKQAKGDGLENVKKGLEETGQKAEKAKTKVKEFKDEAGKKAKSDGLENVKQDLNATGNEADKAKGKVKGFNDEVRKPVNTDGLKGLPQQFKKPADEADKGKSKVKDFFLAFGAVRIAEKAIGTLTSALDGAIKRFDTLNSYPRVLKLMGFDTKQVAKSTQQLSDGVGGLATS